MAHNTLSYAGPEKRQDGAPVPIWLPFFSVATSVIPLAGLGLRSAPLLFVGAPMLLLGLILAIVALICGGGAVRLLSVVGILLSLPGLAWYYVFFFVGIC